MHLRAGNLREAAAGADEYNLSATARTIPPLPAAIVFATARRPLPVTEVGQFL
jgi:hypothetical protein